MVIRTRLRSILVPLFFYLVLGSASGYLVYNASRGQHGSEARVAFESETKTLQGQLAELVGQRESWRHRVDALRNESIDRDLLDEVAHARLNRAAKQEVVIFTNSDAAR